MFSARDYKTAIAVLRAHSCGELADGFLGFQEQAERRERPAKIRIGLLAMNLERANAIVRTDPILHGAVPLSVRSSAHRGLVLDAIVVDSDIWPLSERLLAEYVPCLAGTDGSLYMRLAS